MCLQGFDQSGQEHSVCRSFTLFGNKVNPPFLNTSSISWGISPVRSLAAKKGLAAQCFGQDLPAFLRDGFYLYFDFIGFWPGSLDLGINGKDLAAPGIRPPPNQSRPDLETFQHPNPTPGPPAFPKCASLRLGFDAPFHPSLLPRRVRGISAFASVFHKNAFHEEYYSEKRSTVKRTSFKGKKNLPVQISFAILNHKMIMLKHLESERRTE